MSENLSDLRIYGRSKSSVLTLDRERSYEQRAGYKPNGLWVSVGDDWDRWCRGEDLTWTVDVPVHSVTLTDDAADHLLILNSESAVRDMPTVQAHRGLRCEYIDWPTLASQYGGIVIAPYQWGARLDVMWYYGWDCASGCIWDLALIASVDEMTVAS